MFNKRILICLLILVCINLSCSKFQAYSCVQFEAVCSISLGKNNGVFQLGDEITITAVIPFSAVDIEGKAISIDKLEPWSLWIGLARIEKHTEKPTDVRDQLKLKIIKGRLMDQSTWTDSLKTPQFAFERSDTSFVVEYQITPPTIGVYNLLTRGGRFHKTSCVASYSFKMNLESNNYSFYEEIRNEPWPIHPINDLNPFFIKVVQ